MNKVFKIGELGDFHVKDGHTYLKVKFWNFDNRCRNQYVDVQDVDNFISLLRKSYDYSKNMKYKEKERHFTFGNGISVVATSRSGVSLFYCREELKSHPVNQGPILSADKDMGQIELDWSKLCRKFDFVWKV